MAVTRASGAERILVVVAAVVVVLLWAVVLVGLPTAAGLSPGQQRTPASAPWWTAVAVAVWSGQALSLALTAWGLVRGWWAPLLLAACSSALLVFSTLFVLTAPLTLGQVAAAGALRFGLGIRGWIVLALVVAAVWLLLYGRFLVPVWLGWCPPRCWLF